MQTLEKATAESTKGANIAMLMSWPMMTARTLPLPDRRARIRLETAVWDGLDAISAIEGRSIRELCGDLDASRSTGASLPSAIRNYVLDYFRKAERMQGL
ncbi:hypothetical protein D3877_26710 [Azospirillum cavernae]|uniref:Ribbon-helix-helix domain-containing protein n=1 Tax=Azospirillum cavernae TaxID=2320860 RepID=A0A418VMJ0_9PROT|nr:ribbon-helix-helix domain-containing protein [Azospirillum cavernae]RJF77390.1 hypothetical protein D3877_26710 [Azospirillum cavernae]